MALHTVLIACMSLCSIWSGCVALDERSPQFIYMEHLHASLQQKRAQFLIKEEGEASGYPASTLLATSVESKDTQGMEENGFAFEQGKTLEMKFVVPRKRDHSNIEKAELWLFPRLLPEQAASSGLHLYMVATAMLEHQSSPRTSNPQYVWNTTEECIALDITPLAKKLARRLEKTTLDAANITVQLEVVAVLPENLATSESEAGCGKLLWSVCNAMKDRSSNDPFFVVKYFGEVETGESDIAMQKRGAANYDVMPPKDEGGDVSGCRIASLNVNLMDIFGSFVLRPETYDIRDCTGSCEASGYPTYSHHAIAKERLNWQSVHDHSLPVSCVPITFLPLDVLIYQDGYLLIVEFRDLLAQTCACR